MLGRLTAVSLVVLAGAAACGPAAPGASTPTSASAAPASAAASSATAPSAPAASTSDDSGGDAPDYDRARAEMEGRARQEAEARARSEERESEQRKAAEEAKRSATTPVAPPSHDHGPPREPSTGPDGDNDAAGAVRRRFAMRARSCFDQALKSDPSLSGSITACTVSVRKDGSVADVKLKADGLTPEVLACIRRALLATKLPSPGKPTTLSCAQ